MLISSGVSRLAIFCPQPLSYSVPHHRQHNRLLAMRLLPLSIPLAQVHQFDEPSPMQ